MVQQGQGGRRRSAAPVTDRRVRLLGFLLVILFTVILGRAVWLQTLRADSLAAMGDRQSRAAVSIPATRGMIQDRHGVALAVGERATTVYANPTLVKDPRRAAITAGRALDVNPDTLYSALRDRSRSFVYLQRKADSERAGNLAERRLPGIGFYPEERRFYPQRSTAAHVLGFAGMDNRGLAGLEASFERTLAGHPGSETLVTDPRGRVISVVRSQSELRGVLFWIRARLSPTPRHPRHR